MTRVRVQSSNLESVGYDPGTSTLEVEFKDGAIYQYFNVPEWVYQQLLRAPSKGGYLADHIKDRFRFRRVR